MEQIDRELAARVWKRVQGTEQTEPDVGSLMALIREALEDAAACLRLSKTLGGQGGPLLHLAREDRAQAGCLRGICTLLTGKAPEISSPAPAQSPAQAVLQRCYTHHLHRIREYSRHTDDPNFGPAFEKLATEERNHSKLLLELLGSIPL